MATKVDEPDYLKVGRQLMDTLSDITLLPRPHFRILPPAQQEDEPLLWTAGEKNEIGYIIDDKNPDSKTYSTSLSFQVKSAQDTFVECELAIEITVGGRTKIISTIEGSKPSVTTSDEFVHEISFEVIGGAEPKAITLKVVKSVKTSIDKRTLLFKLANTTPMQRAKAEGGKFDFGNLLDLRLVESSNGAFVTDLATIKGYGVLPTSISKDKRSIEFCDYFIGSMQIPKPKPGLTGIKELASILVRDSQVNLDKSLVSYIEQKFESNGGRLYDFQTQSIKIISNEMASDRRPCLIIARTAAGKTEAFLIPIMNNLLEMKHRDAGNGVKVVLFYPTKALAADQLQRIMELVYNLNTTLTNKITIGVYHGDIEERFAIDVALPIRCVLHEKEIESGKMRPGEVRLFPDRETRTLRCRKCGASYDFVMADRYTVTTKLPDILICTPDAFNYIMMKDRRRYPFLGMPATVKVCKACERICHDDERTCFIDQTHEISEEKIVPQYGPSIFVLDELHLFSSLFGGNVSSLLRRISAAVEKTSGSKRQIQFIATSATIRNPNDFGMQFFGTKPEVVETKDDQYDYTSGYSKIIIFASPRAFRMLDSAAYGTYAMLRDTGLKILTFVNTLKECSFLIGNVRDRLSANSATESIADLIDGHNSTYSQTERALSEERFNRGEIRALIATSTLEVGVDFKELDGMILYGAPYVFNNYLQRLGRAGRKNDSLILSLLNPNSPIDLFYYRNALKIVQDSSEFIEIPPFPLENRLLRQKHVMSSIFDASNLFGTDLMSLLSAFRKSPNALPSDILKYLKSMWDDQDIETASNRIRTSIHVMNDAELAEAVERHFRLTDLRKVDETVPVEFEEPIGHGKTNFKRTSSGGGYGGGSARGAAGGSSKESQWRGAGASREDIEILKQLKGES